MKSDAGRLLRLGQEVRAEPGDLLYRVENLLGQGGQGEVYRAVLNGQPIALKWYFEESATPEQRTALDFLVKQGAPAEQFLWPLALASAAGTSGFGYFMPLREQRYKSMNDLMKRKIEPRFQELATAGLQLAHSYLQLHAQGLCYRDISFGNAFFDPTTGEVLICDNDNVTVNGAKIGGVLGTPRFMAPEVVRGEVSPSTQTDLFSLAVLLFYMLMIHHPLEGKKELDIKCLDLPAMNKLYGVEPIFIFDPRNSTNRPVGGYHDNALAFWPIYPQFLRDLFVKAFTDGIRDPQNGRVRESEWRAAMVRLRDSIIYCPNCASENFYDIDSLRTKPAADLGCWSCGRSVPLPPRIRIGRDILIVLNHDTRLFPHHIDDSRPYDFSRPVAEVAKHPSDERIWGLKNLSPEKWVCTVDGGVNKEVAPGRSVTLTAGTRIHFGKAQGEVRL